MAENEAKQLFMAIQSRMSEDGRQLNAVNTQIQSTQRESRIIDIVTNELAKLDSLETATYKSIGKMFLAVPSKQLQEELKAKSSSNLELQQALNKKSHFLSRSLKEAEDNLKDLLRK